MDKKDITKVLIVCTVPTESSGIPNVIFNLLESMDLSGLKVGYVAINKPPQRYIDTLKHLGVELHVIPRKLSEPWKYLFSLAKVARGYDVIHAHGNSATLLLEMLAGFLGGAKKRIAHCHSTRCEMVNIDKYARPLFYLFNNTRLACGEQAGEWLYHNKTFTIIKNAVNTKRFSFSPTMREEMRSKLNLNDAICFAHVGNFLLVKNHKFLIDVFAEIVKLKPESRLLLIGNGDEMEPAKSQVERLGLTDKVTFAGSLPNPEDYLQAADMIIMPSIYEGLPLTLVEEQASGLPVLASDSITPEANMTDYITFYSLSKTAAEWATQALSILENFEADRVKASEIARNKIAEAGYDIATEAQKVKNIYRS